MSMVTLLTVQEFIQIIIDFFQSVAGIVIISGVTVGGVGYALLKTLRPKTKHERALESALISQGALLVSYKKELEDTKADFEAYKTEVNAKLVELGMASTNVKMKAKAKQWTVEDAQRAIEIAKVAVAVAPQVAESTKTLVTKLVKK